MRILGLDLGSKTVGVAVSDPLLVTAQGVEIIRREHENKLRRTYARIEELCTEYEVDRIVLGYPKNMNNTEGERCTKSAEFKEALKRRTGLPVILWDERLTTVAADNAMIESGIRREDRKEYVDEIAAMLILQGYLDYLKNGHGTEEGTGTEDNI
ncbi:MAG: Holliday junction resolvase RuvX [Lachnospiraceae bacterium]|nr:Holliday junction resolvase RuvX [Lachnospiraceae bacterium]